jgi:uncharacterized protein YecT (DUF1311 family)
MIRLPAVALLLFAALPAQGQMQACATATTQTDMNTCAAGEYQKHDAAMNDVYQRLLAKLTDPKQKALLEDAERAWIAYRDKQCAFQTSNAAGSVRPLIQFGCLDEKTNVHVAELNRQLNCKEGDPSCVR